MAWTVSASVARFDEAMAWFDSRLPVTEQQLGEMEEDARSRAFTIAGATQLDVVQTLLAEMARAVEAGEPMEVFQKRVKEKLEGDWNKANSARLETIFRTNTQTAYNHGRWFQLKDPEVVKLRPFLMYDAVLDSRISDICKDLEGTVLPADDNFWLSANPPMHHRCRSSLRSLRKSQAERQGITQDYPSPDIPDGFGKSPTTGEPWTPDKTKFDSDAFGTYESKRASMERNANQ